MNKDQTRKLKINFTNNNYKEGEVITVKVDKEGVPLSSYWRRRLRDAAKDNCVEWVTEKKPVEQKISMKGAKS